MLHKKFPHIPIIDPTPIECLYPTTETGTKTKNKTTLKKIAKKYQTMEIRKTLRTQKQETKIVLIAKFCINLIEGIKGNKNKR